MPRVIYDGNGADGDHVPVDSNIYTSTNKTAYDAGNDPTKAPYEQTDSCNKPLNILPGNLTKTGATRLLYSSTLR
jgi:hypothetical protein